MLAVEFQKNVENGIIEIPKECRGTMAGELNIIILKEERKLLASPKKKIAGIKKLLEQIRGKNIFHDIPDLVKWQKAIGNEWT
jgi:hypothetical protein